MRSSTRIHKKIKGFFNSVPKIVWLITFVAGLLRFLGIWYGLPLQLNMDEPTLISSVVGLKDSLNPGHFDWPHLYFYINAIFYAMFSIYKKIFSVVIEENAFVPLYIISRGLSAFFGTISVVAIYFLGKEIVNKKVGIISSLFLAFLPIHVYESHFAKVDVAQTFFSIVSVFFIYKIIKNPTWKYFILSGVFIGLTTSIKYNGALLFLALFIATIMSVSKFRDLFSLDYIKKVVLSGIISLITFVIGTPYALLDFKTFWSNEYAVGVLWQFKNVGHLSIAEYPASFVNTFFVMFRNDLGLIFWVTLLLLLFLFLFFNKREKNYTFLLLPFFAISMYITRLERSPSHYFLFLIPFYIPALAMFFNEMVNSVYKLIPKLKIINFKLFLLIFMSTSVFASVLYTVKFFREDTREMAYWWVRNNLDDSKDFLYVTGEPLRFIPFQKNNTKKIPKVDRSSIQEVPMYIVIGVDGVTKEDVTSGTLDPKSLKGNNEPILDDADLVFEAQNDLRFGPPIYIFHVYNLEYENGKKQD